MSSLFLHLNSQTTAWKTKFFTLCGWCNATDINYQTVLKLCFNPETRIWAKLSISRNTPDNSVKPIKVIWYENQNKNFFEICLGFFKNLSTNFYSKIIFLLIIHLKKIKVKLPWTNDEAQSKEESYLNKKQN